MFEESFLTNLCIFAAGQIVAYLYLRTGRRLRGLVLMVGGWVLADVAMLEVFAFQRTGPLFFTALFTMQAWSLFEFGSYVYTRLRRRRVVEREMREKLYRAAYLDYLGDRLDPAIEVFGRLVRRDPWDLAAAVALATALARKGLSGRARRMFRTARHLDVAGRYADVIADELRLCDVASQQRK